MMKPAIALCFLLATPFEAVLADDEQTETLHNNTFQEDADVSCAENYCSVYFRATQHVNTVVTNINCSFATAPGQGQVAAARLYAKNNANQVVNVPVYYLGSNGVNAFSYGINAQVNYFIKLGDTPVFYMALYSGVPLGFQCLISGYHS